MIMKILYLISTYNPGDVNDLYFDQNSYVYQNFRSVIELKNSSSNEIDIVVSDFASGPRTRTLFEKLKHRHNWPITFLFGTDQAGIISINYGTKMMRAADNYDLTFYSVSDAIIQNPKRFDKSMSRFAGLENCDFTYINASPGLPLPKEQLDKSWTKEMPFYRNVHFNVICAKSKFLAAYQNRLFIDIFEGASVEPFVGYMCYSQGGFRRICPFLKYDHVGGTAYTDRKHVYIKGVKARGGGWCVGSKYMKRELKPILYGGEHTGIYYTPKPYQNYPLRREYSTSERQDMHRYILDNLFLKPDEFDYPTDDVKVC